MVLQLVLHHTGPRRTSTMLLRYYCTALCMTRTKYYAPQTYILHGTYTQEQA